MSAPSTIPNWTCLDDGGGGGGGGGGLSSETCSKSQCHYSDNTSVLVKVALVKSLKYGVVI